MIIEKEFLIPHAIEKPEDVTYQARVRRLSHRNDVFGNTAVFQTVYSNDGEERRINCVVGQEVVYKGTHKRITGAEKYRKGQMDVYMLAVLQKLIPEGYNNIVISIAHPPDAISQIDNLLSTVGGKHTIVTPDGRMVNYVIQAAIPFDECSGGLLRALTGEYAEYNQHDLDNGDKVMIVDIGGKVSSITPAIIHENRQVQILFDAGYTFELGIQDVEQSLDGELRAIYPDMFRGKVPALIIDQAIRNNGRAEVHGVLYDFTDAVNLATAPLLNEIERIYIDKMRRAQDVHMIFGTGGGSGKLESQLSQDIFETSFTLADNRQFIQFANMRGGEYAFRQWIELNKTRQLKKLYSLKNPPVYIVMDLGNTFGKSKIISA